MRYKYIINREIGIVRNTHNTNCLSIHPSCITRISNSIYIVGEKGENIIVFIDGKIKELDCCKRKIKSLFALDEKNFLCVEGDEPRKIVYLDDKLKEIEQIYNSGSDLSLNWPNYAFEKSGYVFVADQEKGSRTNYRSAGLSIFFHKKVVWQWYPGRGIIGEATHVDIFKREAFIITDAILHQVICVNFNGIIRWIIGKKGFPGGDNDRLCEPLCSKVDNMDNIWIADSRNNRVVIYAEINQCPVFVREIGADGELCLPAFLEFNGNEVLIADKSNHRVIIVDYVGNIIKQIGCKDVSLRLLSFPRSIEKYDDSSWLIADTNSNRIIILNYVNEIVWKYDAFESFDKVKLYWPRCCRCYGKYIFIADSLNKRILIVSFNKHLEKEINKIIDNYGNEFNLSDIHDLLILDSNFLILVESEQGFVAKIDWNGKIEWITFGDSDKLSDPHQIHKINDKYVVIDKHGIWLINENGKIEKKYWGWEKEDGFHKFSCLKAFCKNGSIVLFSDLYRESKSLILYDLTLNMAYDLEAVDDLNWNKFNNPRFIISNGHNSFIISDYGESRLVEIILIEEK